MITRFLIAIMASMALLGCASNKVSANIYVKNTGTVALERIALSSNVYSSTRGFIPPDGIRTELAVLLDYWPASFVVSWELETGIVYEEQIPIPTRNSSSREPDDMDEIWFNVDKGRIVACTRLWSDRRMQSVLDDWYKRGKRAPKPVINGCVTQ